MGFCCRNLGETDWISMKAMSDLFPKTNQCEVCTDSAHSTNADLWGWTSPDPAALTKYCIKIG